MKHVSDLGLLISLCRCKNKCVQNVSAGCRAEEFTKLWSMASKDAQDAYLQNLISVVPVRRRSKNKKTDKSHASSFVYCINTSTGKTSICKATFLGIFGVTVKRVRRLCDLLLKGTSPKDKRGIGISGNAIPGSRVKLIIDHIMSFPVKVSRYSTKTLRFLSERLNVKVMHKLYGEKYPDEKVNYYFYLKIFRERFSLTFGRPQVDTCCTCEALDVKIKSKNLNDAAKRVAIAEKIVHLRRSKKFYSKLKSVTETCTKDPTHFGVCMDYMQNLSLPVIPVQETFYLRQLTVNVFDIHELSTGKSNIYLSHEGENHKGCNEVCSYVLNYIENNIPNTVKHLHIFSDGCSGQNKNHALARVCAALVETGRFETLNQYFPIRGHSFLPCDRDFAFIKRNIKKHDRIYSMKEYADLIVAATDKIDRIVVTVAGPEMILDCKK